MPKYRGFEPEIILMRFFGLAKVGVNFLNIFSDEVLSTQYNIL